MSNSSFSQEKLNLITAQLAKQQEAKKQYLIEGVQTAPVPQSVLDKLIWISGWEGYEIMTHHPGYDLHSKLESFNRALETYRQCYADLIAKLYEFDIAAKDATLFQRPRSMELEHFEMACRKEIFSLSSAAATLVKVVRHIIKYIPIDEFDDMRKSHFDGNQHVFIMELRNNLNHVTFLESGWAIKNAGQEQTSHFEFRTAKLLRDGDFNEEALKYIQFQKETIDVKSLFASYNNRIDSFYAWLVPEIENQIPPEVKDYRKCRQEMQANSARCWYRVLFQQIIKPETDLYSHLHKYLTAAELQEIEALPHQSKEQVDRIIELVDEYGACNDELREMAYSAFKVT